MSRLVTYNISLAYFSYVTNLSSEAEMLESSLIEADALRR